MGLLWSQAVRHMAMPWTQHPNEPEYTPVSVRHAGYAGYVGSGDDKDLKEFTEPPVTRSEDAYWARHNELPQKYHDRHQDAFEHAKSWLTDEDKPDIDDSRLHHFRRHHWGEEYHYKPDTVDLTRPIYATQTHVAQEHMDRYRANAHAPVHNQEYRGLDADAPIVVTHEGRRHVIDGHHRIAAGIGRGDTAMPVLHFNLDHHYMPDYDGRDEGR